MKIQNIVLVILLSFNLCNSQAPTIQWQKTFGGSHDEYLTAVTPTSDGGYIFVGPTNSTNGSVVGNAYPYISIYQTSYWIVKVSSIGDIEWQRVMGGFYDDRPTSVIQTTDGGYVIGGYTKSSDGDVTTHISADDFWIIKLNSSGTQLWQKCVGALKDDRCFNIKETSDGGLIAIGYRDNPSVSGPQRMIDVYVVKLDSNGITTWSKFYGGSLNEYGFDIIESGDGGYIFVGKTKSLDGHVTGNHGNFDAWVVKINSTGIIQWQKAFGGTLEDGAYSIVPTTDGNFVLLADTLSEDGDVSINISPYKSMWVIKITPAGNMIWEKSYATATTGRAAGIGDESYSVARGNIINTNNNGFVFCGLAHTNTSSSFENGYFARINESGDLLWEKWLGSISMLSKIRHTPDGGFIASGYHAGSLSTPLWSIDYGSTDGWLLKFSPEVLATDQFERNGNLIIYPNPSSDLIHIELKDYLINNVTITDIFGKRVISRTDASSNIDISQLSSGIYFIEVDSDHSISRSKFIKK